MPKKNPDGTYSVNESPEGSTKSAPDAYRSALTVSAALRVTGPAAKGKKSPQDSLGGHPSEVAFFHMVHAELVKAMRFFERIHQEYTFRVSRLHEGSQYVLSATQARPLLPHAPWSALAKSAYQVYRDLLLLETYAIMTYCAFSKILKKHDKHTGRSTKIAFMQSMVNKANFSNTQQLQAMITGVQEKYNEASEGLVHRSNNQLGEDERLFLHMVSSLNRQCASAAHQAELAPSVGAPGNDEGESSSSDEDGKPKAIVRKKAEH